MAKKRIYMWVVLVARYLLAFLVTFSLAACSGGIAEEKVLLVEKNSPIINNGKTIENLGIETIGGRIVSLIESGNIVPCEIYSVFSTVEDNQKQISIKLYRGNSGLAAKDWFLGEYQIVNVLSTHEDKAEIKIGFIITRRDIYLSAYDLKNESFVEVVRLGSKSVNSLLEKAKNQYITGKNSEAIESYKKLLEINPEHEDARIMLGVVYGNSNNLKEAEKQLKIVIEKNPENYRAHGYLGSIYTQVGRYKEALEHIKVDLKHNPKSTIRLDLARIYESESKFEKAEKEIKVNIGNWPKDPAGYLALYRLYSKQDKIDEAVKSFEKALALDENLDYKFYLSAPVVGELYTKKGQYQKAVDFYKRILKKVEFKKLTEALKSAEAKIK